MHDFRIGEQTYSATIEKENGRTIVRIGNERMTANLLPDGSCKLSIGSKHYSGTAVRFKDRWLVEVDSYQLELFDAGAESGFGRGSDSAGAKDKVYAPMPGKIVKLLVAVGDPVSDKQPVVIVEAMKMENQVNARAAGTVRAIHFAAGDQVDTERPIIELDIAAQ